MAIWTVHLPAAAEADYREILRWTKERFGPAQAHVYADTLSSALIDLTAGRAISGTRERPEIGANIRTLHVGRQGHKGRHFVLYRASQLPQQNVIDVLRLLHDGMDLARHLPPGERN